MALNDTDRGRLFFALLITLVAVPSLWWFSRDDAAPDQSTVTTAVAPQTTEAPPTTVGRTNLPPPEAVDSLPIFLDGPEGQIELFDFD